MPICRHYAFTVWPKHLLVHTDLKGWFEWAKTCTNGITYLVMQHERGTKQKGHHIQGFVTAATKKRPSTLGNQFHLKPECFQKIVKGSTPQKNRAYCTKDEDRLPGTEFFEYGTVPKIDVSKVDGMCDLILKQGLKRAIDSDPGTYIRYSNGFKTLDMHYKRQKVRNNTIHVIVICGPPGAGKSWWAKNLYDPGNTFTLPAVPRSGQAWFDYYDGERTLVIDECSGRIEFELFKNMLDPLAMLCPIKGDHLSAMWDTVIITTNFHPNSWYSHDVDWWGTDTKGPLQRRIHWYIEAMGDYNKGTQSYVVNNWEMDEVSPVLKVLPTREMQEQAQAVADAEIAPVEVTSPSTVGDGEISLDPSAEELQESWDAIDNLFGGIEHLDPSWGGPDPDGVIDGIDGDPETVRGINIDPSKDVH